MFFLDLLSENGFRLDDSRPTSFSCETSSFIVKNQKIDHQRKRISDEYAWLKLFVEEIGWGAPEERYLLENLIRNLFEIFPNFFIKPMRIILAKL